MINYNNNIPINDWNNGSSNIVKVYRNNRVVYHKVTNTEPPIPPTPSYSGLCRLTLNDGSIVEIEGEGALTSNKMIPYSSACISAEIGDKCTSIGSGVFRKCPSLSSVTIGNSVTSIGDNAFNRCSSLSSVTIGNSVTSIGTYAFEYCTSLTSIIIPDSATNIGKGAFEHCSSLSSVTIPDGVTSIGNSAFMSCTSLEEIIVKGLVPATLGVYAFDNTNNAPIMVDCSVVDTYKSAWSSYKSRITCRS